MERHQTVRHQSAEREQQHEDNDREGVREKCLVQAETGRSAGVARHVGDPQVVEDRAGNRDPDDAEQAQLVFGEQRLHRPVRFAGQFCVAEVLGLLCTGPQPQDDQPKGGDDRESYPPAERVHLRLVQSRGHDEPEQRGEQHAYRCRHLLERPRERAPPRRRTLHYVRHRAGPFATGGEALHEPGHQQHHGCEHPDALVGRTHRDDETTGRHQGHGQRQCPFATVPVGVGAQDDGADRAHEESHREDRQCGQKRGDGIA